MKFEYQDIIDKFIQGNLNEEEQIAFDNEMESNKEFQDQVSFTKKLKDQISSREEKKKKMNLWAEENNKEVITALETQLKTTDTNKTPSQYKNIKISTAVENSRKKKRPFWFPAFAAVFIVVFFTIKPLLVENSNQTLPNDNYGDGIDIFEPIKSGGNIPMVNPVEKSETPKIDTLVFDSILNSSTN